MVKCIHKFSITSDPSRLLGVRSYLNRRLLSCERKKFIFLLPTNYISSLIWPLTAMPMGCISLLYRTAQESCIFVYYSYGSNHISTGSSLPGHSTTMWRETQSKYIYMFALIFFKLFLYVMKFNFAQIICQFLHHFVNICDTIEKVRTSIMWGLN